MKMNKTEMQVAMHYLINRVNRENYGMLPGGYTVPSVSMRDELEFSESGWSIDRNMKYILKDEKPVYKVIRKYGKGGKSLKPSIEYIESDSE